MGLYGIVWDYIGLYGVVWEYGVGGRVVIYAGPFSSVCMTFGPLIEKTRCTQPFQLRNNILQMNKLPSV